MTFVRRFGQSVLVILLAFSAGGVFDLWVPEPCSLGETEDSADEAKCPATCVRCHCCGQAGAVALRLVPARTPIVAGDLRVLTTALPLPTPDDILHVPRPLL